jgi:hypothetical protein
MGLTRPLGHQSDEVDPEVPGALFRPPFQVAIIKRTSEESRGSQEKLVVAIQMMKAKVDALTEDDEQIKRNLDSYQSQVSLGAHALDPSTIVMLSGVQIRLSRAQCA